VALPGHPGFASAAAALAAAFGVAIAATAAAAFECVHRRDRWHIAAAGVACALALASTTAAARASAVIEYDAEARQVLAIARTFHAGEWAIVAPPIHRVQISNPVGVIPLADFLRRYDGRAASGAFRIDIPVRDVFVFVEKTPLRPAEVEALAQLPFGASAAVYRLPNARARLERAALQWCEEYRSAHAGVTTAYEDDTLRVYRLHLR